MKNNHEIWFAGPNGLAGDDWREGRRYRSSDKPGQAPPVEEPVDPGPEEFPPKGPEPPPGEPDNPPGKPGIPPVEPGTPPVPPPNA